MKVSIQSLSHLSVLELRAHAGHVFAQLDAPPLRLVQQSRHTVQLHLGWRRGAPYVHVGVL